MSTRAAAGFTLAELAVVLAILALLLGGMLVPLAGQQDMRNRQETERSLAVVEEALLGFALVHGRLPCPATATLASGTGGDCPVGGAATVAGCEATSGAGGSLACVAPAGVLPWATLGLAETDAWGNRYTYRVSALFARGIDPAQTDFGNDCALNPPDRHSYDAALADGPRLAAFALCTPGDIGVAAGVGGTALASKVPAIVVSHGKDGAGAYTPQGSRRAVAAGGDEAANADDDAAFVASPAGNDLVRWLPGSILVGRMLSAGKLP